MRNDNIPQPSQIILISPWLDITLKNEEIKKENAGDPILDVEGLQRAGLLYAGGDNPSFYMLSPINGPVDDLAPISIFIGTKDLLEADTRKFRKIMEAKGIPLNYFEYEDMLHDWVLYDLPESKQAKEEIFNLIRGK
jgi:acetyl esterase/lipase